MRIRENDIDRHRALAEHISEAAHRAGLRLEKTDNRPSNLGVAPSLALARAMNNVVSPEVVHVTRVAGNFFGARDYANSAGLAPYLRQMTFVDGNTLMVLVLPEIDLARLKKEGLL